VRSLEYAFECGATAASLIPTRGGNGAMEELADAGDFSPPPARALEEAMEEGMLLKKGRVFADLWNAETWLGCHACRDRRVARLHAMNLEQRILEPVACYRCKDEA
jgi:archaeosine synthase beta-subunit